MNDWHAIIILGSPAAGNTIADPIARQFRAAIIDPDDAKLGICHALFDALSAIVERISISTSETPYV
jgi:hypothetical protein